MSVVAVMPGVILITVKQTLSPQRSMRTIEPDFVFQTPRTPDCAPAVIAARASNAAAKEVFIGKLLQTKLLRCHARVAKARLRQAEFGMRVRRARWQSAPGQKQASCASAGAATMSRESVVARLTGALSSLHRRRANVAASAPRVNNSAARCALCSAIDMPSPVKDGMTAA